MIIHVILLFPRLVSYNINIYLRRGDVLPYTAKKKKKKKNIYIYIYIILIFVCIYSVPENRRKGAFGIFGMLIMLGNTCALAAHKLGW